MATIIKYELAFSYQIDDLDKWVDDFQVNREYEIIVYKGIRRVEKKYMDKTAQSKVPKEFDVAIYNKNKWITMKDGKGIAITSNKKLFNFVINITDYSFNGILTLYSFKFEYHILITILGKMFDAKIINSKDIIECRAIIETMKLEINGRSIITKNREIEEFEKLCKEIEYVYNKEEKRFKLLFDRLDKPVIDPASTHKAIAYEVWYNAKRSNQREWPKISTTKVEGGLEFPENSGIYYWHPSKIVGLNKRHDINSHEYIPTLYQKEKKKDVPKIPNDIRTLYRVNKKIEKLKDEKYIEINYRGEIINAMIDATVIVYNGFIISKYDKKVESDFEAQILDKQGKRIKILRENKWYDNEGPRVLDIPALPYNYKQIIHDANKVGKLRKGEIMDLTDIGIYNNEIITYPDIEDLYISKMTETRRLITLKVKINVNF